jgi:hypothetical protein
MYREKLGTLDHQAWPRLEVHPRYETKPVPGPKDGARVPPSRSPTELDGQEVKSPYSGPGRRQTIQEEHKGVQSTSAAGKKCLCSRPGTTRQDLRPGATRQDLHPGLTGRIFFHQANPDGFQEGPISFASQVAAKAINNPTEADLKEAELLQATKTLFPQEEVKCSNLVEAGIQGPRCVGEGANLCSNFPNSEMFFAGSPTSNKEAKSQPGIFMMGG